MLPFNDNTYHNNSIRNVILVSIDDKKKKTIHIYNGLQNGESNYFTAFEINFYFENTGLY